MSLEFYCRIQRNFFEFKILGFYCRWVEFYGRHNGGLSHHPPGDASVFVRKKYLPFVSETLDFKVYSKFITELRCRSTFQPFNVIGNASLDFSNLINL
jgi:hypothetical protein